MLGPRVTDHAGNALPQELDFFAPPPPEIGEVQTAFSTLKQGEQPLSTGQRLAYVFGTGAVLGIIGWAINYFAEVREPIWFNIWRFGLPLLGGAIGWFASSFSHTCNYVGADGAAEFRCSGSREEVKPAGVFKFSDGTELRNREVRRFTNGVYQGTDYSFVWTDSAGAKRFSIDGTYHSKEGNPNKADRYHFGTAAERAWSVHLHDRAQAELDRGGAIRFNLEGGNYVAVGRGFVDLCFKGNLARCESKDIETVSIEKGVFTVKRKDARVGWFSSEGVFSFPYASMANARLFLFSLEKLAGIRFT